MIIYLLYDFQYGHLFILIFVISDPSETGENPTLPNTCTQSGYKSYGDGCYKLDEVPRTYDTARTMCENEGAFLASIGDGYDEAFVETVLLKNGYAAAWIGLRQNPVYKKLIFCGCYAMNNMFYHRLHLVMFFS